MPQVFEPGAVLAIKLALLLVGTAAFGATTVLLLMPAQTMPAANATPAQPIPFSHKHHVGDVGLDCRFCHTTVEKSAHAGMPSAQLCLTCHSQLFADQSILAPLRAAIESGQPIAWVRMNRLPDYVYFDHSVHIAKGVACSECHGRVDQMPLFARMENPKMKWCFSCHEAPAEHIHAADQVFAMPPRAEPVGNGTSAAAAARLESRRRLTDCSTCHR